MSSRTIQRRTSTVVLVISIVVWILLFFNPGDILNFQHCYVKEMDVSRFETIGSKLIPVCAVSGLDPLTGGSFPESILNMASFPNLILGWALMLVAMMLPLTLTPVQYIMETSFKQKRVELSLQFLFGYLGVWMLTGLVMVPLGLIISHFFPDSWLPSGLTLLVAMIWECAPVKQHCLNRGHRHLALPAFGWAASLGALRFGTIHGLWCVGSCWALMLWPMFLSHGHDLGMLISTIYMVSGHLESPQQPGWELRLQPRLFNLLVYQVRIRLKKGVSYLP